MLAFGVFAAAFALYGLVAPTAERLGITRPLVFLLVGALTVAAGWSDPLAHNVPTKLVLYIAEATLALSLFVEASRVGATRLRRESGLAVRMLGPAMLGEILIGTLLARALFPMLDLWECAALGVILAPSDLSLAAGALHSKLVPERVRHLLDIEAALSDGPAVTLLLLCLAGATVEENLRPASFLVNTALEKVGLAIVIGAAVGLLFRRLVGYARTNSISTPASEGVAVTGFAVAVYAFTHEVGGSGLVAAFVAGLAAAVKPFEEGPSPLQFTESEGELTGAFVFFALGLVGTKLIADVTWREIVYAVVLLVIVRPAAVWVALRGTGFARPTVAFVGWFGPRGLAAVVLALFVLTGKPPLPAIETLSLTAMATVALSVVVHGFSAWPLVRRYSAWAEAKLSSSAPERRATS